MTRDEAREYFQKCGLDYSKITLEDIYRLVAFVSEELRLYFQNGGEKAKNMNMTVSMLRKKDVKVLKRSGLKYARIQVDGSYFKRREGITFSQTGFIGFGGELDSTNVQPILKAFIRWCDCVKEKEAIA